MFECFLHKNTTKCIRCTYSYGRCRNVNVKEYFDFAVCVFNWSIWKKHENKKATNGGKCLTFSAEATANERRLKFFSFFFLSLSLSVFPKYILAIILLSNLSNKQTFEQIIKKVSWLLIDYNTIQNIPEHHRHTLNTHIAHTWTHSFFAVLAVIFNRRLTSLTYAHACFAVFFFN